METSVKMLSSAELEACLDDIRSSPKELGILEFIVRRPAENLRETLEEGELTFEEGLKGDNWRSRGSSRTADGSAHADMQLNIINSRVAGHIAVDKDRWQWMGDQLFIDLDLSEENVPAGTRLAIGEAEIEVSAIPHLGCKKFTMRFGLEAMQFVNSPIGRKLHLRGINAKVVKEGKIRRGDRVIRL